MSFFNNFPLVDYYFSETDPNSYLLRHIIRRFKVEDAVKKNVLIYQNYIIADGESPDMVSYHYYDRPDWHWIILMYNDIINPLVDWPRSSSQVIKGAREKYFVTRTATFTVGSINVVVNSATGLSVGSMITGVGIPEDLYIVAINGNTLTTNIVSSFGGAKTVKIDTILATHHILNSKGIVIDPLVYQGTDLRYIRNIDYENELNDKHRIIKMPMREHAAKIEMEAAAILKGA